MHRVRVLSVGIALMASVLVPAAPALAVRSCEGPEPEFTYEDGYFLASLSVDLRGCRWWRGKRIRIEASLDRTPWFDGWRAWAECETWTVSSHGKRMKRNITRECSLVIPVEHPPVDATIYEGEFTYPWRNGRSSAEFRVACSTVPSPSCRDI